MNQKGMSIRELVVVLGIIVALCLVSIPIFHQLHAHTSKVTTPADVPATLPIPSIVVPSGTDSSTTKTPGSTGS